MARSLTSYIDPERVREAREDRLDKGGVRTARLLFLPSVLAIMLLAIAYFIQTMITGWRGVLWAVTIVAPLWIVAFVAVANDPYGVNVLWSWFRCCILMKDEGFGGKSLAPLPVRARLRGTFHVRD
jgi:type IV secretory pathway VirB3-like protein